ncbi:MAG: hypothetical protein M1828_000548 [Chrysothrix sp. TS-e1954]|nr:MAG: hypothetical protein M1828_000548 [Chrysothrix sp. TS-e1954]
METIKRMTPSTPRVISPTPDPSEGGKSSGSDYFGPTTRSSDRNPSRSRPNNQTNAISETGDDDVDQDGRARSRSRSIDDSIRLRRMSGLTSSRPSIVDATSSRKAARKKPPDPVAVNGSANGHLSPASAAKNYLRELSRSPSPLGLIPIHREWRSFIHRHEIPRKALHVSIGFLTLYLYSSGKQTEHIHPPLLYCLVPIALVDVVRHNYAPFNRFYIRCLGPFMRETEAHERYNGVIWYLLGAWSVMRFCPKDVAVMSVMLLSWCDTAASTIGRAYGRYTPRVRRGKSLAGSLAAFTVGTLTAAAFWGVVAPRCQRLGLVNDTVESGVFAFQGVLSVPHAIRQAVGWTAEQSTVRGSLALAIVSACTGLIASASEAVDIFGWDDNVTIPVLCGAGLWAFFRVFAGG